jgi:hypothetical protein
MKMDGSQALSEGTGTRLRSKNSNDISTMARLGIDRARNQPDTCPTQSSSSGERRICFKDHRSILLL